nr:hypothetical protein [Deltaproteobacteria bacterium]
MFVNTQVDAANCGPAAAAARRRQICRCGCVPVSARDDTAACRRSRRWPRGPLHPR